MHTISEFKNLTQEVVDKLDYLAIKFKQEKDELGEPQKDTIRSYNALYFQMEKVFESLENGLLGIFPWEG